MNDELDLSSAPGFIEAEVADELPGLRLSWVSTAVPLRPTPPEVVQRLYGLSNRYRGASVVAMRSQAIPHAYRAFYRQIGLDPDADRIPSERVALERLLHGQFRSRNMIDDALLIAVVETGVPVWALDADLVDVGGLGIRATREGDRLGRGDAAPQLAAGRLAVVDAGTVHALLFGKVAPGHGPGRRTSRMVLFAIGVQGVPEIHMEEALWVCAEVLNAGRG
ncbi:MAG: hypothetical protein ACYC91_07715 [Solirubrobacteraceae bacterium]